MVMYKNRSHLQVVLAGFSLFKPLSIVSIREFVVFVAFAKFVTHSQS